MIHESITWHQYYCLNNHLDLEGSASTSSSSSFELSSLRSYIRFSRAVRYTRCFTHMSASLTCISSSLHQQRVLASWCFQRKLVERQDLAASLQHADTSALCESESTDGQLWYVEESDVVGDGTNNNANLLSLRSLHSTDNSRQ